MRKKPATHLPKFLERVDQNLVINVERKEEEALFIKTFGKYWYLTCHMSAHKE